MNRKIGILGGTFDPIHDGHIFIAQNALMKAQLDEVWFMPTKIPPHKQNSIISNERFRGEMIQMAIRDFPQFVYSDFELQRLTTTYTADTFELLVEKFPLVEWFYIVGADSLCYMDKWYQPERIFNLTSILVAIRNTHDKETVDEAISKLENTYDAHIQTITSKEIPISSSEIRAYFSSNHNEDLSDCSFREYISNDVIEYIMKNNIYKKRS